MMPTQMRDPVLQAGSLPSLSPLAGFPASTLTEQLRLVEINNNPELQITLSAVQQIKKSEGHMRRKRRREKNKVAAARCRNKKKERTGYLQKESERLELLNGELKAQIESLKKEKQHLVHMLNQHRPTCIVRRDSVQTPEKEQNPLLQQLSPAH
uniref:Jun dimerization protein 2b n=1 Tax=Astyanax mexicanus TaxID=7994 RepID=A0A3B1IGS0_ASTMX